MEYYVSINYLFDRNGGFNVNLLWEWLLVTYYDGKDFCPILVWTEPIWKGISIRGNATFLNEWITIVHQCTRTFVSGSLKKASPLIKIPFQIVIFWWDWGRTLFCDSAPIIYYIQHLVKRPTRAYLPTEYSETDLVGILGLDMVRDEPQDLLEVLEGSVLVIIVVTTQPTHIQGICVGVVWHQDVTVGVGRGSIKNRTNFGKKKFTSVIHTGVIKDKTLSDKKSYNLSFELMIKVFQLSNFIEKNCSF